MNKIEFFRTATAPFATRYGNFIGGKWVAPAAGRYFDNFSPVNGAKLCEIARSDATDVEAALDAAHAAKDAWGRTSVAERALILNRIADRMEENLELLALAETWDNGKPIRETTAADLPLAIDHFRYFAGCIRAQEGGISEIDHDTVAYHFHEPLGVVGQIIPWNFPLLMACWKLAPALAAGNCVVLKPAEQTPASILVLVDLIGDLLPAGVLNIVNGFGLEAGKPLASSPRIAKIAFTGETTTGRLIMQYASQNLIPVTLELGGKSPEHLLRRRHGRGRRLLRQGDRGLRDVRAQPGRGLHLPEPRAGPRVDLRPLHGAGGRAGRGDQAGQPARPGDDDRRAGLERAAGEDPVLHRHRPPGRRRGADRRRAQRPAGRARPAATTSSRRCSRATTRCGSSRRRSSARWSRSRPSRTTTRRWRSPTTRSTASAPACGPATCNRAYRFGRAIQAGRVWTNCYHAYPAHAAFGGYKQSGIGRENHKMMLDHYQQTKNLLVSYSPKKLGFF